MIRLKQGPDVPGKWNRSCSGAICPNVGAQIAHKGVWTPAMVWKRNYANGSGLVAKGVPR